MAHGDSDTKMVELLERLDERTELWARLDERTERIDDTMERLQHVLLEGNGTPAITVQVATLNTKVSAIEEGLREQRVPRHVSLGIIVSIIMGALGLLVAWKG